MSVFLVENDILDPKQSGSDGDYYQQHVVRSANSAWGDVIEWDADDEFEYECLLDPAKVQELENTEIVVAVGDYDANDISNNLVNNAFSTREIDWNGYSGIEAVTVSGQVSEEYYDVQGQRLHTLDGFKGIVIKKMTDAKGGVSVEKIMY